MLGIGPYYLEADEQRLITDVLYDRPIGLLPDSSYKVNEIDLHIMIG